MEAGKTGGGDGGGDGVIVRETRRKGGVRSVRLVDYATGKVVTEAAYSSRTADPWVEHWSLSMGARTDEHASEIREKCHAANVPCSFDKMLRLKVDSTSHQRKLMRVLKCHNLDSYY